MHALLLLSDGRFPNSGYAYSSGLEAAVASGSVTGVATLRAWLEGRLTTAGRVEAAFAAAAWARASSGGGDWSELDRELAARTVSAAARRAARAQGRGILRAAGRCWPHPAIDALTVALPQGPGWPIALGVSAVAASLDGYQAALVAAASGVSGPAWAAGRLLGLDPFDVASLLADLGPAIEEEALGAARWATAGVAASSLSAAGAPELDIAAELHARWEVRLFAS